MLVDGKMKCTVITEKSSDMTVTVLRRQRTDVNIWKWCKIQLKLVFINQQYFYSPYGNLYSPFLKQGEYIFKPFWKLRFSCEQAAPFDILHLLRSRLLNRNLTSQSCSTSAKWFTEGKGEEKTRWKAAERLDERETFCTSASVPSDGESSFLLFRGPIAASAVKLASLCRICANSCCCICGHIHTRTRQLWSLIKHNGPLTR